MTPKQETHLLFVKEQFAKDVDMKYRKGQAEHGGNLWDSTSTKLLDAAIEEVLDLYVYLITMRHN